MLNITKLFEFQSYISIHKPDIIVINETWLKPDILDNDIISKKYTLFRLDRTKLTHPPDPNNPKKFRLNSGDVLIAINNSLDLKPKLLKLNSKSETLSVTLALKGSKKLCITTCCRVGTLGHSNHNEISKHIQHLGTAIIMKSVSTYNTWAQQS